MSITHYESEEEMDELTYQVEEANNNLNYFTRELKEAEERLVELGS